MRILTFKKTTQHTILTALICFTANAQEPKAIKQDPRFEQLLNEKRKINNSNTIFDRFKIQIFTGESEACKKVISDFRKANKNIDATIVFHTPIYKVWVGNYKTRIEAEKKLIDLKKKFPNAFLIKPTK